ncbi:hypothetical protein BV898_11917 [Hypsibius exemplaris]|uniref:Uncharacterized protein n=1 Tax=Hypsibius exemplaris TaxID=2072580 RepID=A0A1W0WFM9_HYPEX|nr:hypothetical protein BV898_11917 [Hypsibius exemplaris]
MVLTLVIQDVIRRVDLFARSVEPQQVQFVGQPPEKSASAKLTEQAAKLFGEGPCESAPAIDLSTAALDETDSTMEQSDRWPEKVTAEAVSILSEPVTETLSTNIAEADNAQLGTITFTPETILPVESSATKIILESADQSGMITSESYKCEVQKIPIILTCVPVEKPSVTYVLTHSVSTLCMAAQLPKVAGKSDETGLETTAVEVILGTNPVITPPAPLKLLITYAEMAAFQQKLINKSDVRQVAKPVAIVKDPAVTTIAGKSVISKSQTAALCENSVLIELQGVVMTHVGEPHLRVCQFSIS